MLKFLNTFAIILILCVAFTSCERVQQIVKPASVDTQMMPDPIMDEVLMAYKSWRYAQPLPAPPATFTEARDSGSAHGIGERTVYIDGIDHYFFYDVPAAIDAGTPVIFPAGLTIVKEIMDDTNAFVWRVAVMQKTDDTRYADHDGWMYAQYRRDSETDPFVPEAGDGTEKGSEGCYNCHAKAAHDSVFVTELLLALGRARLEAITSAPEGTDDNTDADADTPENGGTTAN